MTLLENQLRAASWAMGWKTSRWIEFTVDTHLGVWKRRVWNLMLLFTVMILVVHSRCCYVVCLLIDWLIRFIRFIPWTDEIGARAGCGARQRPSKVLSSKKRKPHTFQPPVNYVIQKAMLSNQDLIIHLHPTYIPPDGIISYLGVSYCPRWHVFANIPSSCSLEGLRDLRHFWRWRLMHFEKPRSEHVPQFRRADHFTEIDSLETLRKQSLCIQDWSSPSSHNFTSSFNYQLRVQ